MSWATSDTELHAFTYAMRIVVPDRCAWSAGVTSPAIKQIQRSLSLSFKYFRLLTRVHFLGSSMCWNWIERAQYAILSHASKEKIVYFSLSSSIFWKTGIMQQFVESGLMNVHETNVRRKVGLKLMKISVGIIPLCVIPYLHIGTYSESAMNVWMLSFCNHW